MQNAFDRNKAQEEGIIVPAKNVIKEYDDAVRDVEECIGELDVYLSTIRKQLRCSVRFCFVLFCFSFFKRKVTCETKYLSVQFTGWASFFNT